MSNIKLGKIITTNLLHEEKNKSKKNIYLIEKNLTRRIFKMSKIRLQNIKSFIIFLIIINISIQPVSDNENIFTEKNFSKITLKINGIGYKNVFTGNIKEFNTIHYPNEIYINGNQQNIINYTYYLNQTKNVVELVWHNSINRTSYMFLDCIDITEIDLSNFDSSQILNTRYMFTSCISLTSINFENFDTSKVTEMFDMFRNCSSLTSLNLSGFDTSNVTNMQSMFEHCTSLSSLNLSNFISTNLGIMAYAFNGCSNLEYINLKNFEAKKLGWHAGVFDGTPDNIVICLTENNKFKNSLKNDKCYVIDCTENWKLKQKKISVKNNQCSNSCNNISSYVYNGKCVENCPKGILTNYPNECICELEKCLLFPSITLNLKLCTKCNYNYYPIENDPLNIGEYINCYKNPEGYYLDKNESLYKQCYKSCKTCEIKGDDIIHNCLSCNNNFLKEINFTNYTNCYENCSYYYYFDNNSYHCTINSSCPDGYPILIEDKMECVKNDNINVYKSTIIDKEEYQSTELDISINTNNNIIGYKSTELNKEVEYISTKLEISENTHISNLSEFTFEKTEVNIELSNTTIIEKQIYNKSMNIKNMIENILITNNKNETIENKTEYYDTILHTIENIFTSENYDTSKIDSGEDDIVEDDKMKITLTTTYNLKNNIDNNNMTIIDLGNCEIILRQSYNISDNITLYVKKIDVYQEGMKIPKIEYDVYCKLYSNNLIKLNLTVCENTKISLSVPVIITEDINKLNTSSDYYNDKCYSSKSDSGTDIILNDRKNEFIEGNKTVCQDNCDFSHYNYSTQKANCSCNYQESSSSISDMKINTTI